MRPRVNGVICWSRSLRGKWWCRFGTEPQQILSAGTWIWPSINGGGHGRFARRRQRDAGARLQGKKTDRLVVRIDPGVVSLANELRGHERHAAYEGAMLRYLRNWLDQLRWQRLKPFEKLSQMLLDQLEGILNYCHTKVSMGVVEAVNDNITSLLRRGRGYQNLHYLLLKAQRMAVTNTEFVAFRKAA
jgi:Transposase